MSNKLFYKSNFFSFSTKIAPLNTKLIMQVVLPYINTRDLPHIVDFLKTKFPSVLGTKCFNYYNLPFIKEVEATEFGHLFEHILLDQLCILKLALGYKKAVFNGRTEWNWKRDPKGLFHIIVDIGEKDIFILNQALKKTINLTEELISSVPLAANVMLIESTDTFSRMPVDNSRFI